MPQKVSSLQMKERKFSYQIELSIVPIFSMFDKNMRTKIGKKEYASKFSRRFETWKMFARN